jgi:hypothetical protein
MVVSAVSEEAYWKLSCVCDAEAEVEKCELLEDALSITKMSCLLIFIMLTV